MTTLNTFQKIDAIETSGLQLVWDGCHKIYFLEGPEQVARARECGYGDEDFHPASDVRELILASCGLVFVSRMGRDNDDYAHPWNIDQCTEDIYIAAGEE